MIKKLIPKLIYGAVAVVLVALLFWYSGQSGYQFAETDFNGGTPYIGFFPPQQTLDPEIDINFPNQDLFPEEHDREPNPDPETPNPENPDAETPNPDPENTDTESPNPDPENPDTENPNPDPGELNPEPDPEPEPEDPMPTELLHETIYRVAGAEEAALTVVFNTHQKTVRIFSETFSLEFSFIAESQTALKAWTFYNEEKIEFMLMVSYRTIEINSVYVVTGIFGIENPLFPGRLIFYA